MRAEDAADEGARAREPAHKRARMMEGAWFSLGAGKEGGGWTKGTGRGRQGEAPTERDEDSRREVDRRWAA